MEKRKPNDLPPEQCLAVDTDTLCKLLCCGRHTAVQIGDLANARITMNTRVLWSVQRIKEYLYDTGLKTVPTPFKVWSGDCSHRLNISRFLSISSRSFSLGPLASSGWPCSSWSFKVVFSFSNEASIILWIFANVCSSVGVE